MFFYFVFEHFCIRSIALKIRKLSLRKHRLQWKFLFLHDTSEQHLLETKCKVLLFLATNCTRQKQTHFLRGLSVAAYALLMHLSPQLLPTSSSHRHTYTCTHNDGHIRSAPSRRRPHVGLPMLVVFCVRLVVDSYWRRLGALSTYRTLRMKT